MYQSQEQNQTRKPCSNNVSLEIPLVSMTETSGWFALRAGLSNSDLQSRHKN